MPSFTSQLPQEVRKQIDAIIARHGVNYSDALNEMWNLVGDLPMYDPRIAGPQWEMTVTWNTRCGDFYATGKGHNKKASRREAAGALLVDLGLIEQVETKLSHLHGAAQRQRFWEQPRDPRAGKTGNRPPARYRQAS